MKCKNCGHDKKWHSYSEPHECNMIIETIGYQDGHWEAGYCTCNKFVPINTSQIKDSHNQLKMVSQNCGSEATDMSTGVEIPTPSSVENIQQETTEDKGNTSPSSPPRRQDELSEDGYDRNSPTPADNNSKQRSKK